MNAGNGIRLQPTIVIAEDERDLRASMSMAFEVEGYETRCFEDGVGALEFLRGVAPQDELLLITDMLMPRMPGLQLIEEVKKFLPLLPVIVVTGYGDKPMLADLLRLGCDEYLDKPIEPEELLGAVVRVIEHRRTIENNRAIRLQAIESMGHELRKDLGKYGKSSPARDGGEATEGLFALSRSGDTLTIRPNKDFTDSLALELKESLERALAEKIRKFVFDFTSVQDVECLALSTLCALALETAHFEDGKLEIANASAEIVKMFHFLRLDIVFSLR